MSTPNTTKLFPLLVRAVAQALHVIFRENRHADQVVEQTLKQNPKAGSRDRAFIAETTYDVVRHYRLYCEILEKTPGTEADFWEIIGVHLVKNAIPLPDWREFKTLNKNVLAKKLNQAAQTRKLRESIPDWLDERGSRELGARWDETLHWLNRPAQVVLRANRLKTGRDALQKILREEGVETQTVGDRDALVLARRQNLAHTKSFQNGLFEVQDFSSQLVAPFLAPAPGMSVVDACAGAGGKTLQLAALLQNRGSLVALDVSSRKLDELRARAHRAGATNIEVQLIEGEQTIKKYYGTADCLLLDVPCSGLGILRRHPDTKWKLSPETIDNLRTVQHDILQSYSPIVKPGGRMVYATCSVLPSENEEQVAQFLASEAGRGFKFLREKTILPQDEGFDGFYMALLEKAAV